MTQDIITTLIGGILVIIGFWILFTKMDRPARVYSIKLRNGELVVEEFSDRPDMERE